MQTLFSSSPTKHVRRLPDLVCNYETRGKNELINNSTAVVLYKLPMYIIATLTLINCFYVFARDISWIIKYKSTWANLTYEIKQILFSRLVCLIYFALELPSLLKKKKKNHLTETWLTRYETSGKGWEGWISLLLLMSLRRKINKTPSI